MKIAIRGHQTREKEVARILESLGGENRANHSFTYNDLIYYLDSDNFIICAIVPPVGYREYTLEEFEKEFPFKIGDKVTIAGLPDFPKIITKITWDCDAILYSFEDSNNTWFHADALKKFEMKEERNITLTLDKAKEWYKKGGELKEIALQAFTEGELNPLPRSWDEFCEKYPVKKGECWIGTQDTVYVATNTQQDRLYKNWIQSKKSAEAHLAMIQLEQLRNCWWNGWEPEWDISHKYAIKNSQNGLRIIVSSNISAFLVFPTKEMAEEFLIYFRDLIEKAKDLI